METNVLHHFHVRNSCHPMGSFYIWPLDFRFDMKSNISSGRWYSNFPLSRSSINNRPNRLLPTYCLSYSTAPQVSTVLMVFLRVWSSTIIWPAVCFRVFLNSSFCSYFVWRQNFIQSTIISPQSGRRSSFFSPVLAEYLMFIPRAL